MLLYQICREAQFGSLSLSGLPMMPKAMSSLSSTNWTLVSHEIQELLDNSENDEKLRDLDNAYGLSQSMRSKIALLEQAKILQELTITRLREDADRMEAEQEELKALQAELKVNLQRAKTYIDTRAQLNETKKAAIDGHEGEQSD